MPRYERGTYRLTVEFYSPMVCYHSPTLDSVVSYAMRRRENDRRCVYLGPWHNTRNELAVHLMTKIIKHIEFTDKNGRTGGPNRVAVATRLQLSPSARFMDSWKKRFDSQYQHMADFGPGNKRRIDTASGPHRSHNMPLPAKHALFGWWEFTGDGSAVLDLLESEITGIGKKVSEGFGWVRKWTLEPSDATETDIMSRRPIPLPVAEHYDITGPKRLVAWRPPYWLPQNRAICIEAMQ